VKIKLAAVAAVAAAALGTSTAHASQFIVNNVSYPYLTTANISGDVADPSAPGGYFTESGTTLDGPIFLTGQVNGKGPNVTIFTLCMDLFHDINAGAQTIIYNIGAITGNNANSQGGAPLASASIFNMSGLARLAYQLYSSNDPDWVNKTYAIQGAIWADEYSTPGHPFSVSFNDPTVEGYFNTYSSMTFGPPPLPGLHSTDAQGLINVQSLIPTNLPVPEPSTWAMMLVGFGGLGAAMRGRRKPAAAAA
jgi:hypothetical protein